MKANHPTPAPPPSSPPRGRNTPQDLTRLAYELAVLRRSVVALTKLLDSRFAGLDARITALKGKIGELAAARP